MQDRAPHGRVRSRLPVLRISALAALPMSAAVAGAVFDERLRAGFTTWRTACRAAGFSLWPVIDFTLQLLPHAVYGLLLGGLALLVYGATDSGDGHGARC